MTHTREQKLLLWGSEVTAYVPGHGRRPARTVRVEDKHVGFATALALVVAHGSTQRACGQTLCPRCGRRGETERDFGTRVVNGQRRPQSWCRSCRAAQAPAPTQVRRPEPGWLFDDESGAECLPNDAQNEPTQDERDDSQLAVAKDEARVH